MKQLFQFFKQIFVPEKKTTPEPEIPPEPSQKDTDVRPKPQRPKKNKWSIEQFVIPPKQDEKRFHDFNLPLSVMHAISDLGFQYCTPVQAQILEHTLSGKDATAKAQTGTGKSASFILTILNTFIRNQKKIKNGTPRALILAPTRELVHQIEKDFKALAKYNRISILAVFGGTGYAQQQNRLKSRPVDVIAATPGRLIDFMGKKLIDTSQVEIAVIDEADRMLDMGFIPDVRRIIYKTPHKDRRQTLFFSATLTEEVLRLAASWTRNDAVQIEIDPEQTAAETVEQIVYITTEDDKFKHVFNLIHLENLTRVILFVNRKDTAKRLSSLLKRYGKKCSVLSGDVSQDKRFKVLDQFKNGRIHILVATDVAARGLHIENISHVINYDMPFEAEHYIHRIGRTGRAGASGTSVSFADETSSFLIPKIEEVLGYPVKCEYPSEKLETPLPKPQPPKPSSSGGNKKPYKRRFNKKKRPYSPKKNYKKRS